MVESMPIRILVVDDEAEMRQMIVDYLRDVERFEVTDAHDAVSALSILAVRSFDLILSDINMPGMKGFELLKIVREKYPAMKRVLITAYNVEDYLELALNHDIGNIFVKTVPFNFTELLVVISNLFANDIFGLDHHFAAAGDRQRFLIRKAKLLDNHARVITGMIDDQKRAKHLELVIIELLTNAIFYGVRNESPENKEIWNTGCELSEEKAIVVTVAKDAEKYGISISDEGGRLKKTDVLYWMNRQISRDENGLPIGLFDLHGRGLFIARRYIDRIIVNVAREVRTEVIILNYYHKVFAGYKPLYINEI